MSPASPVTRATVHLDRLDRNVRRLQDLAGTCALMPCVKANAYGHGAEIVARRLVETGYQTLCVAHASEAVSLLDAGVDARFLALSPALPEEAELFVEHGIESAVCSAGFAEALSRCAARAGREVAIHLLVDTGMGRAGIRPDQAAGFLERCAALPGLRVHGLMSHFPRADEADKAFARGQIEAFQGLCQATRGAGIEVRHLANSAGIFDLPESYFDAVRPGIAVYGFVPGPGIASLGARELEPVLEWNTAVSFLKEVGAGVGLSYGHTFTTRRRSLIATLPVGYGDGLHRRLSNRMEVLVRGVRCPQVGTITMDQMLIDVTELASGVGEGDPVVLIGGQGDGCITADELAATLGTIHYEVVTAISARVPRVAVG